MGGNPRKNPPKFSIHRCYERYRCELLAWIDLADYDRSQIAQIIALDLPCSDAEGDVRGKVFEDIGDQIKNEAGIKILTDWLDKHYRVDEIARVVERIKKFLNVKRKKDEPVTQYLSAFDVAYNALNKGGDTRLPQSFLMYYVMENAGLTAGQWQLVMSGIDTIATGTLYDQARSQIIKIMGVHNHKEDNLQLRQEGDAMYAGEDVLYGNAGRGKSFQQRSAAGQWRPNIPQYQPRFPYKPSPKQGFSRPSNVKIDVPLNPVGKDGKRNLCNV